MTYSISQTDPAAMTSEEIDAEFAGFIDLAEEVVARMAVLLAEKRKRRQPHPFFQHSILRFWESIADNRLHPKAAILLANRDMIKAVIPLPHKQQLEIAYGKEIATATQDGQSENMPIHRMDGPTLKRAFGPEGIRSIKAQSEIIREANKVERHGAITVDRTHGRLRIGNQTFTPDEFDDAFLALGFKIVLARDADTKAG